MGPHCDAGANRPHGCGLQEQQRVCLWTKGSAVNSQLPESEFIKWSKRGRRRLRRNSWSWDGTEDIRRRPYSGWPGRAMISAFHCGGSRCGAQLYHYESGAHVRSRYGGGRRRPDVRSVVFPASGKSPGESDHAPRIKRIPGIRLRCSLFPV